MATASITREQLIERLVGVFRRYGYEGTSLAILSKETGLGRSSLYHHFPSGKEEMARASLAWALDHFDQMVIEPLRDKTLSPRDRLHNCAAGMSAFYADGSHSCLINIFSVGGAELLFQKELAACVTSLSDVFAKIALEHGISIEQSKKRGELLVIEIQGALVISRTLGSKQPFSNLMCDFPGELLKAE